MRKGFTLNELLAVLLILAIIALITTPIITGVMERVRKSAAGSSALGYISAVEKAIAESGYNKKKYVPGEVDILLADNYKDVDVNGDKPTKGTLNVADNLVIESSVLCVNNYRVEVEGHKVKNVIKNGCDNIKSPYQEELLKGTWPKLSGDLIPVTIDSDGGVKKANVYDEWYKYEDKRWANAVLLDDDKILDLSGNNNHGYLQAGATKGDNSVTTDGIDDYTYASLENYEYGSEFSIIIRFKFLNFQQLTSGNGSYDVFGNIEVAGTILYVNKDFKFGFQVYDENASKYVSLEPDEIAQVDTWYTLVGTIKDNKVSLYKDGKLIGEPITIGKVRNSKLPFFIGNNMDASCDATTHTCSVFHDSSNIEFSDALIFDRALSEEEIKNEFSDEIGDITNQSDLRLRYDLDDEIKNDTVLPEEVIESYFVWIPKFKYQLWDLGDYSSLGETVTNKAQEIKIEFDAGNTGNIDGKECVATNKSGDVGNCKVGDWMTHPAFTSLGVNGIWVGKFETGYKGANDKTTAQVDTNESEKIIIKPNVYAWQSIKVKNIFEASYNYERDLDSHMLKNTEWGAIAYLSHSKYGINKEIGKNNNSNHLTGCGDTVTSDASESCNNYTTTLGIQASTTGNVYGIYDLVGGSSEYVAGYLADNYGESGFDADSIKDYTKYFDVYQNNSNSRNDYTGRILGDATGEMGPFFNDNRMSWYDDHAHFVYSDKPWFYRGGYHSDTTHAGQFKFSETNGEASGTAYSDDGGFRVVLSPK